MSLRWLAGEVIVVKCGPRGQGLGRSALTSTADELNVLFARRATVD